MRLRKPDELATKALLAHGVVPSFEGLSAASRASSYAKKMSRSSDTVHERILRASLWKRGLRYRKNVRTLPGKPDIVFPRERVAVFCDGDFWHGRHWRRLSSKLQEGANPSYWTQKIKTNRSRDRRVVRLLRKKGWNVIRIWETDIRQDPERAAAIVESLVQRSR
jgi:DNA mismatch endonuclease, patch repair protein